MGADYYLIPIEIANQYPWASDSLKSHALEWPSITGVGRNPKPCEVREVLDDLSDYSVSYAVTESNWQAEIRARKGILPLRASSLLNAVEYTGNESVPHLFCLEKGDLRLNLLIAERLAGICGPLFLLPDTGAQPLVVTPGSDPEPWMRKWKIW